MGEGGIWTLNISVGNSKKCQLTYKALDIREKHVTKENTCVKLILS